MTTGCRAAGVAAYRLLYPLRSKSILLSSTGRLPLFSAFAFPSFALLRLFSRCSRLLPPSQSPSALYLYGGPVKWRARVHVFVGRTAWSAGPDSLHVDIRCLVALLTPPIRARGGGGWRCATKCSLFLLPSASSLGLLILSMYCLPNTLCVCTCVQLRFKRTPGNGTPPC